MNDNFMNRPIEANDKSETTFDSKRGSEDKRNSGSELVRIFGKETLKAIQETVAKATGLGMVILDYKGAPITEPSQFTPFCMERRKGEGSALLCRFSDVYGSGQALARQREFVYFCPCGLLEMAIPIIIRGVYLGCFYAGQVRCDNAPDTIPRLAKLFDGEMAKSPLSTRQKKLRDTIRTHDLTLFQHMVELIKMIIVQASEKETPDQDAVREMNEELSAAKERARRLETALHQEKSTRIKINSRLNPYFLTSALNAISNLAVIEDSPRTNEMIILCAEFLKQCCLPANQSLVLLSEEIRNLERYLRIQKIRFGNLLAYDIDLPQDLAMRKVPAYVLMPVVERAVFFGLATNDTALHIALSVTLERDCLIIRVTDDGSGLEEEELAARFAPFRNGYEGDAIQAGLAGARQRLSDMFGPDASLDIRRAAGRSVESVIRIPAQIPAGLF